MQRKNDTLLRHWMMLRMLPRYPLKITSKDLIDKLRDNDFFITKRTVERDLNSLSVQFPISLDDRSKPYGWSWQKDAPNFDVPNLSLYESFLLMLADQNLKRILPENIKKIIKPYFINAYKTLEQFTKNNKKRWWSEKIRILESNQRLIPPTINEDIQNEITNCLLHDEIIILRYKNRALQDTEFNIMPLALVQRGSMIYLFAKDSKNSKEITIALNRIISIKRTGNFFKNITVNIDKKIEMGEFDFVEKNKPVQIELRISKATAQHLEESKLCVSQVIKSIPNSSFYQLKAEVIITEQLIWWILAHSINIEVIKPVSLRKEILTLLTNTLNLYKNSAT